VAGILRGQALCLIASMGVNTVQTVSPSRVDLIGVYPARVKMHFCQGWALNNTWSSTANGSGNHYNVNLNNGNVNWNNDTNNNYVSCVR
jgi:hypothetical protein